MGKRALLVEDDLLNRMLFCTWLEGHAFEVMQLPDGRDICAEAHTFAPDLIIMDINLPHVSGVTLIEHLKSDPQLDRIPVLAVTGYAGKEQEDRIRAAGARGYLPKPVTQKEFAQAIEQLLPG